MTTIPDYTKNIYFGVTEHTNFNTMSFSNLNFALFPEWI